MLQGNSRMELVDASVFADLVAVQIMGFAKDFDVEVLDCGLEPVDFSFDCFALKVFFHCAHRVHLRHGYGEVAVVDSGSG